MSENSLKLMANPPSLTEYEPAGAELCPEYWTPSEVGEARRLYFYGLDLRRMPSNDDPELMIDLKCVLFVEPGIEGGPAKVVANGSKAACRCIRGYEDRSG